MSVLCEALFALWPFMWQVESHSAMRVGATAFLGLVYNLSCMREADMRCV